MEIPEIPQIDIPDEVTQYDRPEIGETTPHPSPASPQVSTGKVGGNEENHNKIGFTAD